MSFPEAQPEATEVDTWRPSVDLVAVCWVLYLEVLWSPPLESVAKVA